jgi:hypothetical protein
VAAPSLYSRTTISSLRELPMPSNQERIRTIVDLGTETAQTDGGWQLDNIRFAV